MDLKEALEILDNALDLFAKHKSTIASVTSGKSWIVNASNETGEWYTYNSVAPIKWTTQFRSFMGKDGGIA